MPTPYATTRQRWHKTKRDPIRVGKWLGALQPVARHVISELVDFCKEPDGMKLHPGVEHARKFLSGETVRHVVRSVEDGEHVTVF